MKPLPLLLIGLSAMSASLGACATAPPTEAPLSSAADRHVIDVEQTDERVDLAFKANDFELTDAARQSIASFAAHYQRQGHGPLIMSAPAGGDNDSAAGLITQQTRLALADNGVSYAAIATSTYDASGETDAPIILTFTRFEAYAPKCAPLWEQDLAHQSNNQPWESFGCATQANLAAMIDDPHDLLEPRDADPRDSGRRAVVMDAYRAGHQTHADRSSDEHVSISNVAH